MRFSTFLQTTFALSLLSIPTTLAASVCNGHAELCDRSYGNVTFIGAHDSYAVGSSVTDNQDKSVTDQLNDGIRTLQIQMHNTSSGVHLCHTSCALQDSGTLTSYLQSVSSWISANPNDVVTLVMVNSDTISPSILAQSFSSAGLSSKAYSPPSSSIPVSQWPTLGNLVDAGTTLVVFMDYGADYSSVPYIIDEFSNMWEDAYNVVSQEFACGVNRTSGTPSSQLYMINHFLDTYNSIAGTAFWLPDKTKLNTTNSASGYGSIGYHVGNCQAIYGRNPNHILLDFYDSNRNTPFNLAASLNGVSAPTNTITPGTAATQTTAAGVSGTGGTNTNSNGATTSRLSAGDARYSIPMMSGSGMVGVILGMMGLMVGFGRIL